MNLKKIVSTVYRVFRRKFYLTFRKKYIKKQLSLRKGKCKECGCCHNMLIPCEHFKEPNLCLKWNDLPYECFCYPFDEKDKNEFSKKQCAFHWD